MKKWAKILLVFIGLLVVGYWGYKYVKDTSSLLGIIHVDADCAFKIDIHDIKETLVLDALSSPKHYFDNISFSDSEKKPDSLEDKGIDLQPYSLVFYTHPAVNNTLFGALKIDDTANFEAYIESELTKRNTVIETAEDGSYRYAIVQKSKIALAWNETVLVPAFSPDMPLEKLQPIFNAVLNEGKTIQDKAHPLIQRLSDSDDHMVYVGQKSKLTLNFEDGAAILDGELYTETPQRFQPEITVETVPEASFQFYFDGNFENTINKDQMIATLEGVSFFEKNKLDVSKVINRTNGFVSLAIKGKTVQIDTIISYAYDDNFEKVAKKDLQEKQVPRLHINLGAENESLLDYLDEQGVLGPNHLFEPFPLYQLYVKEDALHTGLDTFKGTIDKQEQVSRAFMNTKIDFEKLSDDLGIPQWSQYLSTLKNLQIQASQAKSNKVVVKGALTGWQSDVNIISQWAFSRSKDSVQ